MAKQLAASSHAQAPAVAKLLLLAPTDSSALMEGRRCLASILQDGADFIGVPARLHACDVRDRSCADASGIDICAQPGPSGALRVWQAMIADADAGAYAPLGKNWPFEVLHVMQAGALWAAEPALYARVLTAAVRTLSRELRAPLVREGGQVIGFAPRFWLRRVAGVVRQGVALRWGSTLRSSIRAHTCR